jgi:5-methylcytosine-specific restriction endonuclease McrA
MERQAIINELMKTYGWPDLTMRLALRAQFRCEYCDRDFIISMGDIYDYDALLLDCIVPRAKWPEGENDFDNLAVSCRACKFLKGIWDPRDPTDPNLSDPMDPNLSRAELIKRMREYLSPLREVKQRQMAAMRALITRLVTLRG